MCGIVGIIAGFQNGFTQPEKNTFSELLFMDTVRGWDSTGAFLVQNNGNVSIRKKAVHGADFVRTKEFKALVDKGWTNGMFMVGHNRAATKGKVTDANAHPFVVDDKIVLVQNGTYFGDHKHHKDTEVDTEAVAHVIAENDDVEKALQKINAAYALVWYNVKDKKLNIIRNNHRPLWIVETTDGGWVFASEYEMILYSTHRHKLSLKSKPVSVPVGELITFTLNSNRTWTKESRSVDHTFCYSGAAASQYTDESDDDMYQSWKRIHHVHNHSRHSFHPENDLSQSLQAAIAAANNSSKAEKNITDYIFSHKFTDFALTKDEVEDLRANIHQMKPDTVAVEFEDYLPAFPADPLCNRWYVYGRLVTPYSDSEKSPLVYTVLVNQTEKQAMDFTTHAFYTCQVPSSTVKYVVRPQGEEAKEYHMLSMFVNVPVPVVTLTETEDALH